MTLINCRVRTERAFVVDDAGPAPRKALVRDSLVQRRWQALPLSGCQRSPVAATRSPAVPGLGLSRASPAGNVLRAQRSCRKFRVDQFRATQSRSTPTPFPQPCRASQRIASSSQFGGAVLELSMSYTLASTVDCDGVCKLFCMRVEKFMKASTWKFRISCIPIVQQLAFLRWTQQRQG